ncbi:MAG: LAGLIDADG family homing endonuclease, partial [Halobacteriales archaeon]|nr:LAGLIDADG family homing endonuclease [Halobacteriales archaeon]
HSFVTRNDNAVVPVRGSDLNTGDWIPVVADLGVDDPSMEIDLRDYLSNVDYWFTSTLTDGGTAIHPGGPEQVRNKQQALEAGELQARAVYPVQGTVCLPERIPLDAQTGFFVGAWLAEGSLTDHYVSVSNVDPSFQERIRKFASRFGLSINEYDNSSGWAHGHDIRVNGKVLADFLRSACTTDGHKTVPGFAFGANDEFVRGLLGGYFSGDGNVGQNSLRASSVSERLIDGIALLLARIGVYGRFGRDGTSKTLRVPKKYLPRFADRVELVGARREQLTKLASTVDGKGPDATDQIPNFGEALEIAVSAAGMPSRVVNSATRRQRIGRNRLRRLITAIDEEMDEPVPGLDQLEQAVHGDVVWERIESIEIVESEHDYVYDFSVEGLETFTTASGIVTHNTMNTFHYAGVAEIDVTQGLPRLIELVDARKTPDTPMM